eukprot:1345905-Amorphochlora_amoeboformis.AAC.1
MTTIDIAVTMTIAIRIGIILTTIPLLVIVHCALCIVLCSASYGWLSAFGLVTLGFGFGWVWVWFGFGFGLGSGEGVVSYVSVDELPADGVLWSDDSMLQRDEGVVGDIL